MASNAKFWAHRHGRKEPAIRADARSRSAVDTAMEAVTLVMILAAALWGGIS